MRVRVCVCARVHEHADPTEARDVDSPWSWSYM